MRRLRPSSLNMRQSSAFIRWSIHYRRVIVHYRMDGAPATAPASSMSTGVAHLDGLSLTQLTCPSGVVDSEPMQSLTRLAATNKSCQVLEAISKTALVLRDAATAESRGTSSPHSAGIGLQALFQNGYDTLVALLQALPQCSSAYGPAAVIPETCVKLFHVHNLLLQAAYASQQDFDVWTELMQAGMELYLLKAPRHIVIFNNEQLEPILDAVAHQDLWRFQRLLWQRLLYHIPSWDSLQDFCSVIQECELTAQAATTAVAAAATAVNQAPSKGCKICVVGSSDPQHDLTGSWPTGASVLHAEAMLSSSASSPPWAPAEQNNMPLYASSSSLKPSVPARLPSSSTIPASLPFSCLSPPCQSLHVEPVALDYVDTRTTDALYDKQTELAEYASLMSECIRAALEGSSARGLVSALQPHAAALHLVEIVTAFDTRQRNHGALTALRHAFIPTPEWLSQVVIAGVQAGERLVAAQVVKLLHDLNALAPAPPEGHGTASRWLNATGQAAVESAVVHHTSTHAWSSQQAVSVLKALMGKCSGPPGDQLCGLAEGLLLACNEARQDVGLMCAVLQEAVDVASASCGENGPSKNGPTTGPPLTAAHLSLVKAALNRASYLVESTAPSSGGVSTSGASTSGSGRTISGPQIWRSREFLFERYPRMLQAARRFGYPLQAFRLEEYADELYKHLATSPGHELVAVGPEGLALVLQAVASSPCCKDPQWAAAFERACLTLVSVQFSVGYTHPKRWLGLLEATVNALPFPMPALAAGIKALLVRLCDTRRHAMYFWHLLPLVGTLERRAAVIPSFSRGHHSIGTHHSNARATSQQGTVPLWTPVASGKGAPSRSSSGTASPRLGGPQRRVRSGASAERSIAGASPGRRSRWWGVSGASASKDYGSAAASSSGSLRPLLPPPDISKHHVSEEEYRRWCEDIGQRLALSMACLSDQDRVAQLSMLGISATGP
ncbi:hypothetical protein VaNZ11_006980 [Volvox africanus]|uniref:Uncharacterized protein n=1 Tax=Volvox africanus TaxID=51714 RepID=A0ABQ5S2I9_9CHLO|nr:hypothetical protein VaNZ11_006980 [Volvox africanus]